MRRSRVILGLRVLLPLAALVLLSTLFLAARKPGPDPVLPYVTDAPEDAARGAGIAGAEYAGVTSDGARLRVTASHAVPQGQDGTARDLSVELTSRDGSDARLTAPAGQSGAGRVALSGGVRLTTSAGWTVTAPEAAAETETGTLTASGGVAAEAPFGNLTADSATLRPDPAGGRVLDLNGQVRLIYRP